MDRNFPKAGAAILLLAAGIHAARLLSGRDLTTVVPLWGSVLLVPILLYSATQYLLEPRRVRPRWGTKVPYYVTMSIFVLAALGHAYRVLADSAFLRHFPREASMVAVPLALLLAAYNLSLVVRHR